MSTHDYIVDNQNGANFRSDLNNALAAIVSNNSSATAPTTTYAFMLWADTASDLLKQRNAADSAWISILTLSTGAPLGTLSSSLLSGALPAIDGSALTGVGKVLQVVDAGTTSSTSTTSATFADVSGVSLSITPSATTSKILIFYSLNGMISTVNHGGAFRLMRDTTALNSPSDNYQTFAESTVLRANVSQQYLDSPSTISATTYKVQIASNITGRQFQAQGGQHHRITAMEIGA